MWNLGLRYTGNFKSITMTMEENIVEFLAMEGAFKYEKSDLIYTVWFVVMPYDGRSYDVPYELNLTSTFTTISALTIESLINGSNPGRETVADEWGTPILGNIPPGTLISYSYPINPAAMTTLQFNKLVGYGAQDIYPQGSPRDVQLEYIVPMNIVMLKMAQANNEIWGRLTSGKITQEMLDTAILIMPSAVKFKK